MTQTVIGIVLNRDKSEVLTVKRRDVPIWVWPGGGLEEGETPEEGVIREIKEETGLDVKVTRKIAELTPVNRLTKLVHLFECQAVGGEIQTGEETLDIGFHPIKDLPEPFFHIHAGWLPMLSANDSQVIRRPLSEVSWWGLFKYFFVHPIRVIRCTCSIWGFPINKR